MKMGVFEKVLKEILIHNSGTTQYQKLSSWFNQLVFNWEQSIISNSDDNSDSGIEDAIFGIDNLQLSNVTEFDYNMWDQEAIFSFNTESIYLLTRL